MLRTNLQRAYRQKCEYPRRGREVKQCGHVRWASKPVDPELSMASQRHRTDVPTGSFPTGPVPVARWFDNYRHSPPRPSFPTGPVPVACWFGNYPRVRNTAVNA